MKNLLIKIDKFLDKHALVLLALLLLLILRIPNLFEPHWYGDESIYLTIGQALRAGQNLYVDIVDHKTPIIYYLAMVPNQLWFRVLLIAWMSWSTVMVYLISRNLFKNKRSQLLGLFSFVLLTTLPWLEGNIPNGELFVMGFVLTGVAFLFKTQAWQWLKNKKIKSAKFQFEPAIILTGIFLGLGVLTKVPAILDFAAVGYLFWLQIFDSQEKKLVDKIKNFLWQAGQLLAGLLVPILLSILYFVVKGNGAAYLQYGLLYNLHYTSTWTQDLGNPIINFIFTLPGKTLILAGLLLTFSLAKKKFSRRFRFLAGWFCLSLFASLLSNRPYPHYFQQLIPATSLLLAHVSSFFKIKKTKNNLKKIIIEAGALFIMMGMVFSIGVILQFKPYPTIEYYQKFYNLVSGKISAKDYAQSFNYLIRDNTQTAAFLRKNKVKSMFIWGTNPMLYDVSDTIPADKFTVSFHIQDLKAYDETMAHLEKNQPQALVVMKNESDPFPAFYEFLKENYSLANDYDHLTIYLKK